MKTIILCGGEGIRLKNSNEFIPKAMIMIDDKPLLWHVMKRFSLFGHRDFILALGKYGDQIRNYFLNYDLFNADISISLRDRKNIKRLTNSQEDDWTVTLVSTGELARTGARLARVQKYISDDTFMLSYADCLSDVNLNKLIKSHQKVNKIATVTGVMPPYRYGEFILKNNQVVDYQSISRLMAHEGSVNGGYMVLSNKIFKYLTPLNECTIEVEVFKKLVKDRQLNVYKHDKFWQCIDNDREFEYVKRLCEENKRYWLEK